jgi:hypothetical protein
METTGSPTGDTFWTGLQVMDPTLYMTTRDLYLFWNFKKHLPRKQFATDADVKQAVTSWLQKRDTDICYAGIQAFVLWWDKPLNVNGP